MGVKPTTRYPMAHDMTSLPALRRFLCGDGPDGCIGCESPCAYGVRYWRLRDEQRRQEQKALRSEVRILLTRIEELEMMIGR